MKAYCKKCDKKVKIKGSYEYWDAAGNRFVCGRCAECKGDVKRLVEHREVSDTPAGEQVCSAVVALPAGLKREALVYADEQESTLSAVVSDALTAWLHKEARDAWQDEFNQLRSFADSMEAQNDEMILDVCEARATATVALNEALEARSQVVKLAEEIVKQAESVAATENGVISILKQFAEEFLSEADEGKEDAESNDPGAAGAGNE